MKRPLPSHPPGSIGTHPGRGRRAASYRGRAHAHHTREALTRRAAAAPPPQPPSGARARPAPGPQAGGQRASTHGSSCAKSPSSYRTSYTAEPRTVAPAAVSHSGAGGGAAPPPPPPPAGAAARHTCDSIMPAGTARGTISAASASADAVGSSQLCAATSPTYSPPPNHSRSLVYPSGNTSLKR